MSWAGWLPAAGVAGPEGLRLALTVLVLPGSPRLVL